MHIGMMKFQVILMMVMIVMSFGREGKEGDKDVNYDEAKVPAYDLPELLVTAEGRRITTAEEWYSLRRPQIMSLFSNLVYGRVPEPSTPMKLTFREVKKDGAFMRGKATRKDVEIQIKTEKGAKTMRILLFVKPGRSKATHRNP